MKQSFSNEWKKGQGNEHERKKSVLIRKKRRRKKLEGTLQMAMTWENIYDEQSERSV